MGDDFWAMFWLIVTIAAVAVMAFGDKIGGFLA